MIVNGKTTIKGFWLLKVDRIFDYHIKIYASHEEETKKRYRVNALENLVAFGMHGLIRHTYE